MAFRQKLVGMAAMAALLSVQTGAFAKTTVNVWGLFGAKDIGWDKCFVEFEKSNPGVQIKYTQIPFGMDKYLAAAAGGIAPDIILAIPGWTQLLMSKKLLVPAPRFITDDMTRVYYPAAMELVTLNGGIWGIPIEWQGNGMAINKTLFAEKGLNPVLPKSWEEIGMAARKLASWDGDVMTKAGIDLTMKNDWPNARWGLFHDLRGINGAPRLANDLGNADFKDTKSKETMQFLFDMINVYRGDSNSPKLGTPWTVFNDGKMGMRMLGSYETSKKSIPKASVRNAIDFGPIPGKTAGLSGSAEWGWMASVSRASKNQQMAWKIAAFMGNREYSKVFADMNFTWYTRRDIKETSDDHLRRAFGELQNSRAVWAPSTKWYDRINAECGAIVYKAMIDKIGINESLNQIDRIVKQFAKIK